MSRSPLSACGLLVLLLSGCHQGSGSDIGPKLQPLPPFDFRVTVRDDAGDPATGALVTVSGTATSAVTGRSGRAFLRTLLEGARIVTIDGTAAAASDSSHLGTLNIATVFPGTSELPFDVYLPDGAASVTAAITTGVQGAPVALDDSANSGAILTVAAGDTVTHGAAATVTLRAGSLTPGHLPPTLTDAIGGPAITSRGVYVFPEDVQFSPGASISLPNTELALPVAQPATLYRLDPATGTWIAVGAGAESGGRIAAGVGSVTRGGLYCFGVPSPTTTQVTGRLLDARGLPVFGALVRAAQAHTRSDGAGRFALDLPRFDAGGSDRQARIEASGGRLYLPARVALPPTLLDAATVDIGDQTFDTFFSTNVRTLSISRGRIDPFRRLRVSNSEQLIARSANGGAQGQTAYDDVAAEFIGFLTTVPRDEFIIRRRRAGFFLLPFSLDNALSVFTQDEIWRTPNSGGTLVQTVDRFGTGPVSKAHAMIGQNPAVGYIGLTDFNGFISVGKLFFGQFALSLDSQAEGRRVVSAFTVVRPGSGRAEVPIERALRPALGRFRRFGMYEGNLTNTVANNTRLVRGSGVRVLQDFLDEVLLGLPSDLAVPVQVTPSASTVAYRLGVPEGTAHVVAAAGNTAAGGLTLDRVGIAAGLDVVEGSTTARDIDLAMLATQPFTVVDGLLGLDGALTLADLRFDVAAELTNGTVADIAQGLAPASAGTDASVLLPPVAALPPGFRGYVAAFGGSAVIAAGPAANTTVTQRIIARFDGVTAPQRSLMAVPTISAPLPDADVSSNGFRVDYTVPPDCQYVLIRLRSETATEVRDWSVLMPPDVTGFDFHRFAGPMPQVLAADDPAPAPPRDWTLSITCGRVDSGPVLRPFFDRLEVFYRIQANWVGLTEADRQVTAVSSASIQLRMTN